MLRSTFLGYKTATSALKVNQNMMDVVGQNISNINTEGYTRQRLDINSVSFSTNNLKFGVNGVIIGQGVTASGVSQYRDSFLDLRYRTQAAKTGSEDVQLDALSDLENVFDEITTDGLDAQFSDLLEQLHSLTSSPSDPVLEGVVRTSAELLTQIFNDYSQQVNTIENQQQSYLQDGAIEKVNQLTENIAKLNQQIKADNVSGNPALELNDERNMLIDELSTYLDIDVVIKPLPIGGGKSVDELVIKLRDIKNPEVELVNRDNHNELSVGTGTNNSTIINITKPKTDSDGNILKDADGNTAYEIKTETDADGNTINVNDSTDITPSIKGGQIEGYLKFLNGSGEFKTTSFNNKGVIYFKNMLDTLANKFATVMNDVNKAPTFNSDGTVSWTDKPLFEARGADELFPATKIITARNIKISDGWAKATGSYITNTTVNTAGDSTGATDNILKMISKFQSDEGFETTGGTALFSGTFQEFLTFTTTRLDLQVADAQTSYDTYTETQFQIEYARSSMSSVDLNEEGVNLLTYSKSYNAAARLMTTIDEMLDTLINEMAR